jgi:hypothetical protein
LLSTGFIHVHLLVSPFMISSATFVTVNWWLFLIISV